MNTKNKFTSFAFFAKMNSNSTYLHFFFSIQQLNSCMIRSCTSAIAVISCPREMRWVFSRSIKAIILVLKMIFWKWKSVRLEVFSFTLDITPNELIHGKLFCLIIWLVRLWIFPAITQEEWNQFKFKIVYTFL